MKDENDLRDEFAAAMLQGVYSNRELFITLCSDYAANTRNMKTDKLEDYIAQMCYEQADAMLRERNKNNH